MKKVLIITYYWPPSGGGGVQRWVKFVKYLRDYGWEPIVFTPSNPEIPSYDESLFKDIPEDITIIKKPIWEPYTYYKRFTGKNDNDKIQTAFLSEKKSKSGLLENISVWVRGNFFIPDARKFWIRPAVSYLTKYLKNEVVDAIITTGPPHSVHMIGMKLKSRVGIPWLADFRDPWTNIDFYHDLKLSGYADKQHHKLEKRVLQQADAVTVISPGMKRDFERIVSKDYNVIPNGFDSDDIVKKDIEKNKRFSLAHIGSLTKTRNPENLWKALSILLSEKPEVANDLEILIIGKIDISAIESIRKYELEDYLKQVDYLPHDDVMIEQKKATLLLLLINNTPSAKLILTGKIFEYLASETPIICIGPSDGDAAQIVNETKSGQVYDFNDVDTLVEGLKNYYSDFKNGSLRNKSADIKKFDRKVLSSKLAEVLYKL